MIPERPSGIRSEKTRLRVLRGGIPGVAGSQVYLHEEGDVVVLPRGPLLGRLAALLAVVLGHCPTAAVPSRGGRAGDPPGARLMRALIPLRGGTNLMT